jgi:ABC-type lipoprotein export system ATPase subunit
MIEAKNVSKTYNPGSRKENCVLNNASLSLPDTGMVFIVGKSGIGKSTILNAIGGLISYEGEILYNGKKEDIEKYRRRNIGYIFQSFYLFEEISVRDNIKIGLNLAGVYDEKEITRRVGILLAAVGLNINASRSAGALSLGQRQRVAIARALASNPHIILADEPTGNLDSKNSLRIMDILKNLSKDHLVLCVTHNVNLVHLYADKAFSVENKAFTEIDPQSEKLDSAYSASRIDVAALTKQEIQEGNILLKLYVPKNGPKTTLTLVQKDNKILIVGDNISIAKEEDVKLVTSEEKKETAPSDAEAANPKEEKADKVDLNFESRNEKRPFKQAPFFNTCRNYVRGEGHTLSGKNKFGKGFAYVLEVLLPLIIFLVLDLSVGGYDYVGERVSCFSHPTDNVALLLDDSKKEGVSLSGTDISKIVTDKDSGIVDGPAFNSSYIDSSNSLTTTGEAKVPNFEMNAFSVIGKCSNLDNLKYSSVPGFYFSDIDSYKSVPGCKSLEGKSLQDNEILLDSSLKTCFQNLRFEDGGTLDEKIQDTYFRPSFGNQIASYYQEDKETYTIKGFIDTGFATAYANKKTADTFRNKCLFSSLSNQNNTILPDFSDFEILDYKDIKGSTKYSIEDDSGSKWDPTSMEIPTSNLPFAFLSDSAANSFLNPYRLFTTNASYKPYALDGSGNKIQDKKIIVLADGKDGKNNAIDSYKVFQYFRLILETVSHSVVDSTLSSSASKSIPVSLPSSFLNGKSSDKVFSLTDPESAELSQSVLYMDSSLPSFSFLPEQSKDSYIHLSEDAERVLLLNLQGFRGQDISYTHSSGSTAETDAFQKGSFFLSSDTGKTIRYFQNHPEYGVKAETMDKLHKATVNSALSFFLKPIVIILGIILGILVLVLVLDSVSRINANRYRFGVLRCLGLSGKELILDDSQGILAALLFTFLLPTMAILLLMSVFNIYFLGIYYLAFLAGYALLYLLASEIPLLFLVNKKPMKILNNLD